MELLCKFVDRGVIVCWFILIYEWINFNTITLGTSLIFMYLGIMVVFYGVINFKNKKNVRGDKD